MDGVSRKKLNTVGLTWQCWTTKETKSEERSTGGAGNPLGFGVSRLQIGPDVRTKNFTT